jgi:3-oxoacyl-[acyl-carrier protein] reductase
MSNVILTGAASGLGLHFVNAALERGMSVIATDIDQRRLQERAAEFRWPEDRVLCMRLDVRDAIGWQTVADTAFHRWGRIDVLMNIAGFMKPGYLVDTSTEEVDRHFDINVKGLIHGSRIVGRAMVRQGSGHIINIASMAALAAIPGIGLYSSSKFAVRAVSLILAEELRDKGIAVTVVCPDAIETPMLVLQESYEEAALTFSGGKPLTVEDVGKVVFGKVLRDRPLEVFVPLDRGLLAKFANLLPSVSSGTASYLRKLGLRAQRRRRGGGESSV